MSEKMLEQLNDSVRFRLENVNSERSFCVEFYEGVYYSDFVNVLDVFSNYDMYSFRNDKNTYFIIPNEYYDHKIIDDTDENKTTLNVVQRFIIEMKFAHKLIFVIYFLFVVVLILQKKLPN